MSRGKSSGISLSRADASVVLGMEGRGDRNHDIAAWFGVNQGRVAEVKEGQYGPLIAALAAALPPKGPPGVKGRRLRASVASALDQLKAKGQAGHVEAEAILQDAAKNYDADEA